MSLCGRMCTALRLPLYPMSQRSVCKLIPRPAPLAAMANTSGTAKRPCRFVLGKGVPQPSPKKMPRAGCLVTTVKPLPPPDAVRAVLLPERAVLFAVDVETHVMIPTQPKGSWWQPGRFGVDATVSDADIAAMRVVQVGWTIGQLATSEPETKVRLVQPSGFVVDEEAAAKHGISQEHAASHGVPLEVVMRELLADAQATCSSNGRLASHHLGFDGGILACEMERVGLDEGAAAWGDLVSKGICTMNQHVGHWVRQQIGIGDKPMKIPLRLADGIRALLPEHAKLLDKHHDAGVDSHMHWLLARDLIARAKSF